MHWAIAASTVIEPAASVPRFSSPATLPAPQHQQSCNTQASAGELAGTWNGQAPALVTGPDVEQPENGAPNGHAAQHDDPRFHTLQTEVQQLNQHRHELQQQLFAAMADKADMERQLKELLAINSSPRPASGALSEQDWSKLNLRLQKAERALEQERTHAEVMRQQLDAQRASAAVGEHASTTIQQLEADLCACRALAGQRTQEAEALQRALRLGDETVARLRAQLSGLLEANQVAMAREQDMEHQVRELRRQLEEHKASAAEALASAQHAAQHGPGGSRALQDQAGRLEQENQQLAAQVAEQGVALTAARAECARKDAGIRALEAVLSQHGRQVPKQALATTGNQVASPSTAVAIDIGRGLSDGGGEQVLAGGLTDSQWKLVMLSEEVRGLRATVQQLRQQAAAAAAGQAVAAGGQSVVLAAGGVAAGGLKRVASEDGFEVMEVDLPAEEVKARVAQLAKQMLELEEEMQGLMGQGGGQGREEDQRTPQHQQQQAPQSPMSHQGALEGHYQGGQQGGGMGAGVAAGSLSVPGKRSSFKAQRPLHRKGKRRGWWGWLVGAQDDMSLV